ncbi:MAG: inner-rane translocator [Actinomycetia bacterium]|jgi:ribose transport system permease protein|nr:inner-rane translocator [Actinomycetes bacterium]
MTRIGFGPFAARARRSASLPIVLATALLLAVSPLLAPGSVGGSALVGMLPFAAVLALAAAGQSLVVRQGGLDLSVAGMMSLASVIVTEETHLARGLELALVACLVSGCLTGLLVTRLAVTPLIATLAVNALLVGTVYRITHGILSSAVPEPLQRFTFDKTAGIPDIVVLVAAVLLVGAAVLGWTVAGRRFVAAGMSPGAARAVGIRVHRYGVMTYVVASLAYGAAGVLLAGFVGTPSLSAGDAYLLPTIAAVVLAGNRLGGGEGSVVAVGIAALFLTQLQQVVLGMGAPNSTQLIIQGSIIGLGMAARQTRAALPRLWTLASRIAPTQGRAYQAP